ncbi:MAG: heterodisulfide reductase-related iron-sulfur binding cluster [Candidatus Hadarchaeales archaeon]
MRKFALFPGCIIPQRLPSIEIAARKVFQALGMEAAEMKGYNCCPDPVIARYMNRNFVPLGQKSQLGGGKWAGCGGPLQRLL